MISIFWNKGWEAGEGRRSKDYIDGSKKEAKKKETQDTVPASRSLAIWKGMNTLRRTEESI